MEFQEVVDRRRMVRNYDPDRPIPPEVRERILQNALHAPSAGFSQGWAFLVLDEPGDVATFWKVSDGGEEQENPWGAGLRRAPMLIIPLSHKQAYLDRYAEADKGLTDKSESHWPVPYWDIDTGFASLLMLLTVVDEGLAACFFGIPPGDRMDAFRQAFGVPEDYTPIGVISVGYRAKDVPSPSLKRGRRPVEDVVHHGSWGNRLA
ncbi:nitroreductase family protein [Nonomuraea sp. NPDC050556]|uniref:nitroreductase family protein n=1 Tax=Nonomuraea sp. NPDC050556 TaxID=3364369 RepID=UPI00379A75A9